MDGLARGDPALNSDPALQQPTAGCKWEAKGAAEPAQSPSRLLGPCAASATAAAAACAAQRQGSLAPPLIGWHAGCLAAPVQAVSSPIPDGRGTPPTATAAGSLVGPVNGPWVVLHIAVVGEQPPLHQGACLTCRLHSSAPGGAPNLQQAHQQPSVVAGQVRGTQPKGRSAGGDWRAGEASPRSKAGAASSERAGAAARRV